MTKKNLLLTLGRDEHEPFMVDCFDALLTMEDIKADLDWSKVTILYGGGTDVGSAYYGELRSTWSDRPDTERDHRENMIFRAALEKGVNGFIGICRGSQFLTAMNGGKIIQHIGGEHCGNHWIQMTKQPHRHIIVTSTHHQMMYPFNLPKDDYEIIAHPTKPDFRAECYWRNDDEQYDQPECEPEIVWYPKTRTLCIQGHPEYMAPLAPFPSVCRELVKERLLS